MLNYNTCLAYMNKARMFYSITTKLVRKNEEFDTELDKLNSFFNLVSEKGLSKDKVVFLEPYMQDKYGVFLRETVEYFVSLFMDKNFDKICDISYVLDYLLKHFDFSYQFDFKISDKEHLREIGMVDRDTKELFVRRRLDNFPFFIKESATESEARMMYYYFFILFCYDYCVSCCETYVKLLDKSSLANLSDVLECVIMNEKSDMQIPIDYVYVSDEKSDYNRLVFRNIASLKANIGYLRHNDIKKANN